MQKRTEPLEIWMSLATSESRYAVSSEDGMQSGSHHLRPTIVERLTGARFYAPGCLSESERASADVGTAAIPPRSASIDVSVASGAAVGFENVYPSHRWKLSRPRCDVLIICFGSAPAVSQNTPRVSMEILLPAPLVDPCFALLVLTGGRKCYLWKCF